MKTLGMKSKLLASILAVFLTTFLQFATAWSQEDEPAPLERTLLGPTEVVFERSIFFTADDGNPVEIPAGLYSVSSVGSDGLRIEGQRDSYQIRASDYDHKESVESPSALSFNESENVHHVVLLNSDGAGLVAVGSYNGVTTRGNARLNLAAYRTRIKATLNQPRIYSGPIAINTVRPQYTRIEIPATACSDIVLDKFHASSDSNYPNNRLALFTYAGIFTFPVNGVQDVLVVRIPDGPMLWSRVQFTFKTRRAGTETWQESLSLLRPYSPALSQLTAEQATNLGYVSSPTRPCFIKAGLRHPQLNRPYMIGASTWDDTYTGMDMTFVDNEALRNFNNNESIPWSGGAVSLALVGFSSSRPKAYDIEFWYFNDAGTFTKQSDFQLRIENCGRPPLKHGSGSYLLTCNG